MPVKIIELEAENIKRVKAVQIVPALNGLTIIGGDNNQGKTSVLDAIAWALGGDKYRPEAAQREGANTPPRLHVNLSNGLVVERRGKNSALTVSDPVSYTHLDVYKRQSFTSGSPSFGAAGFSSLYSSRLLISFSILLLSK